MPKKQATQSVPALTWYHPLSRTLSCATKGAQTSQSEFVIAVEDEEAVRELLLTRQKTKAVWEESSLTGSCIPYDTDNV